MNTDIRQCRVCAAPLVRGENWTASRVSKRDYSCSQCTAASYHKWYASNPEQAREANRRATRKYREANPEQARASGRKYREANPEKGCKWREANSEKRRANQATRRARKLNACPPWADLAAIAHLEAARWVYASLMLVDESEVHLDHIVPLRASQVVDGKLTQIASGLHVEANLTFKLASDNTSKGCKLDESELDRQPVYESVAYHVRMHGAGRGSQALGMV